MRLGNRSLALAGRTEVEGCWLTIEVSSRNELSLYFFGEKVLFNSFRHMFGKLN